MINPAWLAILKTICDLPTAPLREDYVMAWIEQYVLTLTPPGRLTCSFDRAGNLRVDHMPSASMGAAERAPHRDSGVGSDEKPENRRHLIFEAHVDHPGFITGEMIDRKDGLLRAEFLGGVKPSLFTGAGVRLFHPDQSSPWTLAVVDEPPKRSPGSDALDCVLRLTKTVIDIPPGTIGMWDLPDAAVKGDLFTARVCDDLAGAAAMVCMLHEVCDRGIAMPFTLLFTRAEEIGFIGALAAIQDATLAAESDRNQCCVIGLENSRALPQALLGHGPVLRVGDRTSIFSSALTRFIKLSADDLTDAQQDFKYQRALMDGGTCNSTVFDAAGYDSAGLTLPLANYHNMLLDDQPLSCITSVPRTGESIGSEAIHLGDFANLVELMLKLLERFVLYTGDHRRLQEQLQSRLAGYSDRLYASCRVHRKMEN
jgi:putative aminopeptidase FrvX